MPIVLLNRIWLIFIFLFFTLGAKVFAFFDIRITGLEYMVWVLFAGVLLLINLPSILTVGFKISSVYLFVALLVFSLCVVNFFYSKATLINAVLGTGLTFLPVAHYILFSNIRLDRNELLALIRAMVQIISMVAFAAYLEKFIFTDRTTGYVLRGVSTLAKDPSFLASLLNINIAFCLMLYQLERRRRYLLLVLFSLVTISLLLFIKSLLASVFIIILFIAFFYYSRIAKYAFYIFFGLAVVATIMLAKPIRDEVEYKFNMYFGDGAENIPRNALYLAAFQIAVDHFPLGSGQGTFGSYPVGKTYSDIYYDYRLSAVQGLSPDDAFGLTDSHFIFDTYWSGVLGELGFAGAFLFFLLWTYPGILAYPHLKRGNANTRPLGFVIVAIMGGLFIEGIAGSMPGQLAFMVVYPGLCAAILNHRSAPVKIT